MADLDIFEYYAGGMEEQRLTQSLGRLEWLRTWEILQRHLPSAPAEVVDVGGGTGVYALPLAAVGYRVHLIDIASVHVTRARELSERADRPLASVTIGDARRLDVTAATADAVLLLGPMYHLIDRADRVQALTEARRVLKPGGVLVAAYISRFASACYGINTGDLRTPEFEEIVHGDLTDGVHRNVERRPTWFTTAYFHRVDEIAPEMSEAGLHLRHLVAVEGPTWTADRLDEWLDDKQQREMLMKVLRRLESEPTLLGASAHLLAVAHA